MSILVETKLTNGIVAVSELYEGDVLDTAEIICSSCNERQVLSAMHYDFEDRQFICDDCAMELLANPEDGPEDVEACMDEVGEDDFDPEADF